MPRSKYSDDGSYRQVSAGLQTVGDLRKALADLPDGLPVNDGIYRGVQLTLISEIDDEPNWTLRSPRIGA